MIDINYLDKALVVTTSAFKNYLLKKAAEKKELFNCRFMSLEEFMNNYFFDYDFKAIKYLTTKHNMKIDVAEAYLKNLRFIRKENYDSEKLNTLVKYKKELLDNNLLMLNPYYSSYIKNWDKIIVLGYGKLDRFYESVFADLQAEIIDFKLTDKTYKYVSFDTMENEVQYLYSSISRLLETGADINNIYVMNADDSYESYFNRYNDYFHFKIEEKNESSFSSLAIVKQFIMVLKENNPERLEEFITENSSSRHIERIVSIVNKYIQTDEYQDLIIDELNKTKIKNETYTSIVRRVNLFEPFQNQDYVFLVGFNDNCPALSVDTDYITDDIKDLVGLSKTEEKNNIKKENLLRYLSNIDNLYLSYCKNSLMDSFNPSVILDRMITENEENISSSYRYSDKLNRYRFSKKLDQFSKYQIKDGNLEKLYATYGENNYRHYDHGYKTIERQLDTSVELSYSQVNSYYRCPFKYFVEKKLRIEDETSQFNMQLGNIFHNVLKDIFENNITDKIIISDKIDTAINSVLAAQKYTESEKHFTVRLKEELLKDIEIIRFQHQKIGFGQYDYERKVEVNAAENIKFKGFIDKLVHQKDGADRLITVIDYKTGSEEFKEELVEDGLSLQLPSYLYLANRLFKDENKKFAGFYIQQLINTDNKYEVGKPVEVKKFNSMKLKGKSNSDEDFSILNKFDKSFPNSEFINMTITEKGKIGYSKGIDSKGIENLIQIAEEKIVQAGNSILSNDFPIIPYEYTEACKFCTYNDICYRKSRDFKKIKEMEDEDE